jgi:hypothetical protein
MVLSAERHILRLIHFSIHSCKSLKVFFLYFLDCFFCGCVFVQNRECNTMDNLRILEKDDLMIGFRREDVLSYDPVCTNEQLSCYVFFKKNPPE